MHICCLKCTSVLDKAKVEEVEVDLCPACGGLWLDRGEMERLSQLAGSKSSDVDKLRKLLGPRQGPPAVPSEVVNACPACTAEMHEVEFGPIRIDFCHTCKGLFLDRGELEAAIKTVGETGTTVGQILAAAALTAEVSLTTAPAVA